jgi:iron complex transport system permease protein
VRSLGSPPRLSPHALESTGVRLFILAGVLLAAVIFGLSTGAAAIPVEAVLESLGGGGDRTTRAIVLDLRLPRALVAAIAGGGLALSGAVFQALLRNPLAEPYVLGVSGGAAVGAVAAIVLGVRGLAAWSVPLAAFAGALIAILLVFRIALRVGRALDTRVLLLAGVVVGAFFNAIILMLLTFAEAESYQSAFFWMMGSLQNADWRAAALLTAYMIPSAAALVALARPLNLLAMGEETALYLGTRVERVKFAAYIIASLAVAASVAVCGIIGFIGLIVPHALRLLWGGNHRLLLPGSFLAGGTFLLLADTVARTVAAPAELPVGVITALVGVPLFVLLLSRSMQ